MKMLFLHPPSHLTVRHVSVCCGIFVFVIQPAAFPNNLEMKPIAAGIEENGATEKDLEDVNCMSDKDFAECMWKKFCGRPQPAKYSSQQ